MSVPNIAETNALEFVKRERDGLIDFAARLIATPSPNPGGSELAAAEVAEEQMHVLGMQKTRIVGRSRERANLIYEFDTGTPGPTLLLNGHLDTKPPDPIDAWETDPYEGVVIDGKLHGLGAADMKGPDAALVYGMAAVVNASTDNLTGKVLLILSADEEGAATYGPRYLVEELGIQADVALIAEPAGVTQNWETLPLISRGISIIRFIVKGTQTHSSISDRVPVVNASLEASRLLAYLVENLKLNCPVTPLCPGGPTINLGTEFHAGEGLAKISGKAEFMGDVRTLPGMSRQQFAEDVDRAVDAFRRENPGVELAWEFMEGILDWRQPTEISADNPLVGVLQRAAEKVLGAAPPLGYFPGGTDAIWWQGAAGIPTIPGFGPGLLPNCHKPNEYVEVEALIQAAKIYALTILDYLGKA